MVYYFRWINCIPVLFGIFYIMHRTPLSTDSSWTVCSLGKCMVFWPPDNFPHTLDNFPAVDNFQDGATSAKFHFFFREMHNFFPPDMIYFVPPGFSCPDSVGKKHTITTHSIICHNRELIHSHFPKGLPKVGMHINCISVHQLENVFPQVLTICYDKRLFVCWVTWTW